MQEQGFYPLNNKVLKFDVNNDTDEIRFNHYIIQNENFQRIRGNLPRGQFYMTINSVCKDLNITFAKARGLIKKFSQSGIITNVYTPKRGCKNPSIWKYNSVQKINNDDNNDNNNDSNNDKSSNINMLDSMLNNDNSNHANNEINNSKKEYIKRINKNSYMSDSNEYRLATYFFKFIKRNNPKAREPNIQKWAKTFDYILRIDKREIEEVKKLIKWCQNDNFWFKNILSPDKLRKQYDRLLLEMKKPNINNSNNNDDIPNAESYRYL